MTTSEFHANTDNFCYRHPGRQSFVLCQRCMRTICPECQTQAPVGVICPECMQEQRRSESPAQRRARRRSASLSKGGARSMTIVGGRPLVTYWILGITSAIGLLQMVPGLDGPITNALHFQAAYLYPSLSGAPFEPWRMLTVLLVHGGLIHLGLNMLALWMIGQQLEPLIGRAKFLTLYLVSGLGGSVAVALLAPGMPTVGASGAIFGLFAALIVIGRHLGANVTGMLVVLAINLVAGFAMGFNIAWQAHVGGIVVGALIGLIYARTGGRRTARFWWIGLVAAVTVVLLAVVAIVPPLLATAAR